MSDKARAQRRRAPMRHGLRSEVVVPGGAGPTTPAILDSARYQRALELAISRGDRAELDPVVIASMAPLYMLLGKEAHQLMLEGLVIDAKVPGADGSAVVAKRPNPRFRPVLELARLLGIRGAEQGTTPATARQAGDGGADEYWAWLERVRDRTDDDSAEVH